MNTPQWIILLVIIGMIFLVQIINFFKEKDLNAFKTLTFFITMIGTVLLGMLVYSAISQMNEAAKPPKYELVQGQFYKKVG